MRMKRGERAARQRRFGPPQDDGSGPFPESIILLSLFAGVGAVAWGACADLWKQYGTISFQISTATLDHLRVS